MRYANTYDIQEYIDQFPVDESPNLARGALVLSNLAAWTNRNSDGWAYWDKPVRAAASLISALSYASTAYWRSRNVEDITDAELAKALRPIKAFMTSRHLPYTTIRGLDPKADAVIDQAEAERKRKLASNPDVVTLRGDHPWLPGAAFIRRPGLAEQVARLVEWYDETHEPWCNHDAVAVVGGVCECGERVR